MEDYKVKTEIFEGPLDLLLNLIEKRKLHINDVSLAEITDDYVAYIRNDQNFTSFSSLSKIKNSADFVLVASILMLIKSKSLLPTLNLTLEEEHSIDDLGKRLKIYKRTKELSIYINDKFGKEIFFAKSEFRNIEPIFSPDKKITTKNIFLLMKDVLNNLPKVEIVPKKVVKTVISLEEMIDSLTKRVRENIKMSFNDFSQKGKTEKVNVVISFLALLELVKQGIIMVKQTTNFDDISIENQEVSVPSYN